MKEDILYIVMPAYNEEENIETVLAQWHPIVEKLNNKSRLLIVNDGSKDATYQKMLALQSQYPLLVPIDKKNSGHGATVLFAYREAVTAGADYVFQTDSDGQTNPDEFWVFWENRKKHDLQIGDRTSREDGLSRVFVTRVLRIIVWLIFREWVQDANTPFRLMSAEKLTQVMQNIPEDFFLSNVALSVIAQKKGLGIKWYPITFKPRQAGVNSINLKRIFKIGIQAIGDFRQINKNLKK